MKFLYKRKLGLKEEKPTYPNFNLNPLEYGFHCGKQCRGIVDVL
jgi:hypothetical protein